MSAPSALEALRARKILFDGHFAGDFSLAIVNRSIASALIERGVELGVFSADAGIAYDPVFARRPELASRLLAERPAPGAFDLHMRNMWPPRTDDMVGAANIYVCFAWEELDFPQIVVDAFNRSLDAVLTASTFVTHALLHSGVSIPVHTVGLGADHVPASPPRRRAAAGPARLLHVSSGLPRKGVDVLAEAFATEFSARDDVELYVKTTPGPRNAAEAGIARAAERHPDAAPMLIDERPLDEAAMAGLYRSATALVGPSRGEGFGLPFAEAMRAGLTVVTTGHGGSLDFCTNDTAFLVDATLSPSRSHLAGLHSVWAEPDPAALAARMREAVEAPEIAAAKAAAGQALLDAHFTWAAVARRVALALHAPAIAKAKPAAEIDLVIGARAGGEVGAYAGRLCETAALASNIRAVFPSERGVAALCDAIAAAEGGVLWVHLDPQILDEDAFRSIAAAARKGRHRLRALSVDDASGLGSEALDAFDVVFTPTPEACASVSRLGARNPVVLPKGVALHKDDEPRSAATFRVAVVARPLPDLDAQAFIQAAAIARRAQPELRLDLLCASSEQAAAFIGIGRAAKIEDILTADVAPNEETGLIARLAASDLVAIAAKRGDHGLEAVTRAALAADRPLLCVPDATLPNAPRYAHAPRSSAAIDLAGAIGSLARRPDARHSLDAARRQVAGWFDLDRIAARHLHHLTRS